VSIFALDGDGTALAVAYSDPRVTTRTVGRYFAWRPYFHGGPHDLPSDTPRAQITPIDRPSQSVPYRAVGTDAWRVGVSTPLFDHRGGQPAFAGVLVFSVDIGNFDYLSVDGQPSRDRFAVLVDARDRDTGGRIVVHPYFAEVAPEDPDEPRAKSPRPVIARETLRLMAHDWRLLYQDPCALAPRGDGYRGTWIAATHPMRLSGAGADQPSEPDGLIVLVQERAGAATGPVEALGRQLMAEGALALSAIGFAVGAVWFFALRGRARPDRADVQGAAVVAGPRALRDRSTLSETDPEHV
jgi:hypothetical protein